MEAEYCSLLLKWHRVTCYPSYFERRRNSYDRDGPEHVNLSRDASSLDQSKNTIFFMIPEDVSTGSFIWY